MFKIGRNDPCPCGSGKKYKKCCINKPLENVLSLNIPRTTLWDLDEIRMFSTEEIITRLRKFGVDFQEKQFLEDVKKYNSASELAERWYETYPTTAYGLDEDFIWMACIILWKRLAPDIINSEQLDDMMQTGYEILRTTRPRDEAGACDLWLKVWNHLKERFIPEMKDIEEAEKVFSGLQSLGNWCLDMEMELHNAGLDDLSYFRKRIEFCREFYTLFPESDDQNIHHMKRAEAEAYFMLGESEKGEELFKSLVAEFPDSIWGYVGWGDMYTREKFSKTPPDYDKAEKIYRMALGKGLDEEDVVLERIEDLKEMGNRKQDG
jgi:tetratricopeptide (TPR) repeat protein